MKKRFNKNTPNYVYFKSNQILKRRGIRNFSILFLSILLFFCVPSFTEAATFTVINTNDSGSGSLRQAIIDANSNSNIDTINFNIGSGLQTISLLSALPVVNHAVIIDGTSQPGFSGTPIIVLDGDNFNNGIGLRITGGNSIVKGLVIINFDSSAISLATNGGNTIQGNYIGLDADGNTPRRNSSGISIDASNNLIGGTDPSERNVVSGNGFHNIGIGGGGSNNQIKGNYIGTNAAGTASLGGSSFGVEVLNGIDENNVIGGSEPGAGNLISGNGQYGIDANGKGTLIQGNMIGTDVTGKFAIPNFSGGVDISGSNIQIGGTTSAERNIISGNMGRGINFDQPFLPNIILSKVQGNYIGVDITGSTVLGNAGNGIEIFGTAQIGGTEPGAGNVISGNATIGFGGILTRQAGSLGPTKIEGNLIGTDATGTIALGNSGKDGIVISSNNNIVGGTESGAGNIISGNRIGIRIGGSTTAPIADNMIIGNHIGTDFTGNNPLPNNTHGIEIRAGSRNKIGGVNAGEGNIIAFNNDSGVFVSGSFDPAFNNSIRGNNIFRNAGLGIDIGSSGLTPNDNCDTDSGANNLQNFPVLNSVTSDGGTITVGGTLNSLADSTFTIDFYANQSPGSVDEGEIYLGSASVTTDANCTATINADLTVQGSGTFNITATATDEMGNTSEFSNPTEAVQIRKSRYDFDGDGKTDIGIFRPNVGQWWYLRSTDNVAKAFEFGQSSDKIVPADFTGDGATDIAFWRPSTGQWFVLRSEDNSFFAFDFGANGDIPVPGDFDGDGKADAAVFRPANATYFILKSSDSNVIIQQFGQNGDVPIIEDYDGDGKDDIANFRPSVAEWYLQRSSVGYIGFQFGIPNDTTPTPADFTGDGKADIAFFKPSASGGANNWFVLRSEDFSFFAFPFGVGTDKPVAGDYDGDGKADPAVFRPSNNIWYLERTTAGFTAIQFGVAGDKPIPAAYIP